MLSRLVSKRQLMLYSNYVLYAHLSSWSTRLEYLIIFFNKFAHLTRNECLLNMIMSLNILSMKRSMEWSRQEKVNSFFFFFFFLFMFKQVKWSMKYRRWKSKTLFDSLNMTESVSLIEKFYWPMNICYF